MTNQVFMNVEEVAEELGTSKSYAYKLIQKLNNEMNAKWFITIQGKINRYYFYEKIYGKGGTVNVRLQGWKEWYMVCI